MRRSSILFAVAVASCCWCAAASATAGGASAAATAPATASGLRTCSGLHGYSPKNGGYGLIIEDLRVQRIGCDRAAAIGGEFYAGDPMPPGWHCQFPKGLSPTSCRYRHTRRRFSFQFGGDAGRVERSAVHGCGHSHQISFLATILSVRNMSCDGAERVLERGNFMLKNPIGLGQKAKIGGFRCHVYEDDTPPGPSDVDEKLRCVHGRQAFRYRYAV